MAENFEDVVKKLGSTVKKSSAAKAPAVLAVQMVDSKGKVIKEEKGAAAAEAQREEEKRGKKTVKFWERIADALGGGKGGQKRDPKTGRFMAAGAAGGLLAGGGMGTMMGTMIGSAFGPKIASAVAKMGAVMLPAAIVMWGLTSAAIVIKDFLAGSKDGGAAGGIAKALGGKAAGGAANALGKGLEWAGIGATIGLGFPPIGWLIGALIGAAFGGILGWFGSDKIKKGIEGITDFFGFPVLMSDEEIKVHQTKIDDITTRIKALKSDVIPMIDKEIKVYQDMQAAGKTLTLKEMQALDKLYQEKLDAEREIAAGEKDIATLQRDLERQKLANLNTKRSELETAKKALTMEMTEVGDTGIFVRGELRALELEIKGLTKDIEAAKLAGHTTEVEMLTNRKKMAEQSFASKKALNTKLDEELKKKSDQMFDEEKRLYDKGLLSGWEEFIFNYKSFGRTFKVGWNAMTAYLGTLAQQVSDWIYTPGQDTGPGGMGAGTPAEIFGISLKWPDFGQFIERFKTNWNALATYFGTLIQQVTDWIYTPGQDTGPGGMGAGTPAKIFGVTIPSMFEVGTKIKESWNSLKTWAVTLVQQVSDWIYTPGQDTGPGAKRSSAKLFGVAIPSMFEVGTKIKESWNSLKTWALSWFANNIFDAGSGPAGPRGTGTPIRIFGVAIPSMKEVTGKIKENWSTFKTWAETWFKDNIYSPAVGDTPAKLFGVPLSLPALPEITWPEITLPELTLPEITWPEITLPKITWDDLNLPEWMTKKDFFTIDWPDINIKDLEDGVKNLIRGVLPDPVDDPILYAIVPQKIYDWLGISTAQREAEAKMAEASGELQRLEQERSAIEAKEIKTRARLVMGYSKGQKVKDLVAINDEILAAQNRIAEAQETLAEAATTSQSLFTHDQGLHDRLDKIFPPTVSGQRAAAMTQAGILRGMGGGAGGGGFTSINTGGNVVSAPTTNYVSSGIAARRPIILAA